MLESLVPEKWRVILSEEFTKDYFLNLDKFVEGEYSTKEIFPPRENIFRALELCDPEDVKVVIVGQDPYHGDGQANGLSFSVAEGIKYPPSLRNIFKEVADNGYSEVPENGELERWARQGVLLINSVLTVRAHAAASHSKKGWEKFTDAILSAVCQHSDNVVYMLWGSYAEKKAAMVDISKNLILKSVHPSPLSAYRGWFGSAHFSKANDYLIQFDKKIIW